MSRAALGHRPRNQTNEDRTQAAFKGGLAEITDIGVDEIALYGMDSFRPPGASQADHHSNQFAAAAVAVERVASDLIGPT